MDDFQTHTTFEIKNNFLDITSARIRIRKFASSYGLSTTSQASISLAVSYLANSHQLGKNSNVIRVVVSRVEDETNRVGIKAKLTLDETKSYDSIINASQNSRFKMMIDRVSITDLPDSGIEITVTKWDDR